MNDKSTWNTYKFSEIANNILERILPKIGDEATYIGLEHMEPGSLHINQWGSKTELIGEKLKVQAGDVLFAKRNAYLKRAAVAPFDGIFSAHGMVFRPKSDVVCKEFFPFFIFSNIFMERAIKISVGSLSPTVNWTTLKNEEFCLPPIEEQKRIAEILWAADEMVQNSLKVKTQLLQLLYSFRESLTSNSQVLMNDVIEDIIAGKSLSGVEVPVSPDQKGVLKVSAITDEAFFANGNKCLIDQNAFLPQYSVKKNALIMTRCNTSELVGRVVLVEQDYTNLMLCDKTLELKVDESKYNKLLLREILRSKACRKQIETAATGTGGAMKNISQKSIRNLSIPQFAYEQQQSLCNKIQSIESSIATANEKTLYSYDLLNSLMRKYLGGAN